MITCSIGSLLSPTTQAIIQEINEKYGDENNVSRSFNEFYRKYVELNEPNKKRKIGRARSFGQNDVFHGPNVLNNTEIEMYKYDLEMEIGIRKPKGLSQSNLKVRLDKCNSLESREEKIKEKPAEISAEPPKTTDLEIYDKKEKICDSPITIVIDKCEEKDENDTQLTWGETRTDSETIDEKPEEKETSIQLKENKEEVSELPLNSLNMKSVFKRSQSAPHGVVTPEPSHESQKDNTPESFKSLSKEILFGYDKKLFNGKRKQDMEFEEFEICDSLTEKLEKLEEKNTSSCPNSNSDEINPLGISQTPSNSKMPPKEGTEQCSTEKIICNEENNNINYEDPIELGNSNKSLIIAISKEQGNKTQKEQEFDSSARAEPIETNKKKFLTEEEGDKNNNTSPPIEIEVNLQKSS